MTRSGFQDFLVRQGFQVWRQHMEVLERLDSFQESNRANINVRYIEDVRPFQQSASIIYTILTPYAQTMTASVQEQLLEILRELSEPKRDLNNRYDLNMIDDTISTIRRIITYRE